MSSFKLSYMYAIVSEALSYFSVYIVIVTPPNQEAGALPQLSDSHILGILPT
jgi:hypothetical protein